MSAAAAAAGIVKFLLALIPVHEGRRITIGGVREDGARLRELICHYYYERRDSGASQWIMFVNKHAILKPFSR